MKLTIPFLVDANFFRFAADPVVFCNDPCVKNLKYGPRAFVIDVDIGDITSSACRIVGAVAICLVVSVSTFKK